MSTRWKTVRVFISSTFRDMQAERDYLVHDVFPELRERCARRRLHLIDVDLRWGVTDQEKQQGRVLEICFDAIERCRPFFIGLLGERYGPPIHDVPDDERFEWVRKLPPELQPSATALEIHYGVLRNPSQQTRAFFYFRDSSFLKDLPAEKGSDYHSEGAIAAQKLKELKAQIKKQCRVFEGYPCKYGGIDDRGQVRLIGLETFRKRVIDDLWEAINVEYPEDSHAVDESAIEQADNESFVENSSQCFVGRRDILSQLRSFSLGEVEQLLIVTGRAGCGKSAVLANFTREYSDEHPETFVLSHFIGVSPGSTDIRRSLIRMCKQLARRFDIREEVPTDYYEVRLTFSRFLTHAATHHKVLVVIDALDQLDERYFAHSLDWLPQPIPNGVKVILSMTEGNCHEALAKRRPSPSEISVGELSLAEQTEIVRQRLGAYRKQLDESNKNDQMGLLLSKPDSANPLYLAITCEEMRVFGDFESVTDRILALPNDVGSLIEQVLERIEDDHERVEPGQGKKRVRNALCLLECSKDGLLESEMLELLSRDGEERLPQALWARLYRSLRFYLRPSRTVADQVNDSEGVLNFFHREISTAVRRRYLEDRQADLSSHQWLADYFKGKGDPNGTGNWSGDYPRALYKFPYHLLEGKRYQELFCLARSEIFLTAQSITFPEDPELQLQTLQNAIRAASEIDDAGNMADFMLAHARRVVKLNEVSPLDALNDNRPEQALNLTNLIFSRDKEAGTLWFLLLAWELKSQGRMEDAHRLLHDLLEKALPQSEDGHDIMPELTGLILSHLYELNERTFLRLQERLFDDPGRVKLCEYLLIPSRKDVQLEQALSLALQIAETISDEHSRASALSIVAKTQATSGRGNEAAKTFSEAIKTAKTINGHGVGWEASTLSLIVKAQAEAGLLTDAYRTLSEINSMFERVVGLTEIAKAQRSIGATGDSISTFDEAISVASTPGKYDVPSYAFREIATAQATGGDVVAALSTAERTEIGFDREEVFRAVVEAQVKAGQFADAIETAKKSSDQSCPEQALVLIAKAQAVAGKIDEATAVFKLAIRNAKRISETNTRGRTLFEIVKAQAAVGMMKEANETAKLVQFGFRPDVLIELAIAHIMTGHIQEVGDALKEVIKYTHENNLDFYRTEALRDIVAALALTERFEEAFMVLENIADQGVQIKALTAIAKTQTEKGKIEEANKTFQRALGAAGSFDDFREIAKALTTSGKAEEAISLAKERLSDVSKANALLAIAELQIAAGNFLEADKTFDEAVKAARQIDNRNGRTSVFVEICRAQARAGKTEAAITTVKEITDEDYSPTGVLTEITAAQALAGRYEEATRTAEQIEPRYRGSALCEIAKAQAAAKKIPEALQNAENITDDFMREQALREIAKAQALAGENEAVLKTAAQISSPYMQASVLTAIAKKQALVGNDIESKNNFARAIDAALSIDRQSSRDSSLLDIAFAQASGGSEAAIQTIQNLIQIEHSLSRVAEIFVSKGAKSSLKKLLIPASYHLAVAYRMCGFLAQMYSNDKGTPDRLTTLVTS